ncbi:hypothetical protein AVEN_56755-1 [Araneus ventricosus]|uniref:Uncharacterized protein n=1 Tax=Araneus ventricosus TaxID=182803 RepID=A0A4Y2EXV0_ARAVE|nr:hypothetical protein AVEN_56755-1 [Araneus ventricosus]
MVIGGVDVIASKKREKKTDRGQKKKHKMVKTNADVSLAQSMEILQLKTMFSSSYTDTDVITLEYQSQNRLDFPTSTRECDRYGILDRAAASFASSVLQDIGIEHEGETSHVVDRNKIRRQRKKL